MITKPKENLTWPIILGFKNCKCLHNDKIKSEFGVIRINILKNVCIVINPKMNLV